MSKRVLVGVAAAVVLVGTSAVVWSLSRGVASSSIPVDGVREEVRASPELAQAALDRIERFRAGESGNRMALGSSEVTSLLRYGFPDRVPGGVSLPTVEMFDGEVYLSGRLAVDAFHDFPRLDDVIGLLPDTLSIEVAGVITPFDRGTTMLVADRMEVARVPLPRGAIPDVLSAVRADRPVDLPPDALGVPVPSDIELVFIQGDSLVLFARFQNPGG